MQDDMLSETAANRSIVGQRLKCAPAFRSSPEPEAVDGIKRTELYEQTPQRLIFFCRVVGLGAIE
ncbi:hypothetical protein [Bradyrhizobium sp. SSUT77]|uniref:hypothetical protein n=1 Tax=Bradyrhizobium sp. SSUT77 TaxID=3040603 RepID=UPI00244C3E44|nr:hypothetical protein [Bradyrhizobium sp. SSUT77]MDH2348328.1 hypothetical protein [Bradyrhizobium sp. SSUT77]